MNPITNFPTFTAPNSDYPGGQIKDDSGINDGTQADVATVGDMYQFFYKIMALAGISPNNLPDNVSNGYQIVDALKIVSLAPTFSTGLTWNGAETITFVGSQSRQYSASTGTKTITLNSTNAIVGAKVTLSSHSISGQAIVFASVGGQTIIPMLGTGTTGPNTNWATEIEYLGANVWTVKYSS